MAKGGARPGAGRPKGSYNKPQIREFFTEEEVAALVADLKASAIDDVKVKLFLAEQVFGKARQNIGLDGGDEGTPVSVEVSEKIARKNGL